MVPFQAAESNPLVVKGAQAKKPSPPALDIEQDATTPLKKKPSIAVLEDALANPIAGTVGASASTPLRANK